ncbi:Rrf2 family transcriptional regulator [Candidatus Laterigemmans baculatus]|uniref:Rrf2 family transcriptional regulator n=1 Tax=Candidatus Laterigemmans baculatus TaxID=2770505 RepID=UPI0013DCFEDF|nr:Rrf2 family transcriptional regulator [Candidatus Laterigemmans baculatus]
MHLTTHTDYSLRLLIYLQALAPEAASVRQVAEAYGISVNHLAKVAQRLTQLGWISSRRGRGGGLVLGPNAAGLKLGQLIRTLEPSTALAECHTADSHCPIEPVCHLKSILSEAQQEFFAALDRYTLGDLAQQRDVLVPLLVPQRH